MNVAAFTGRRPSQPPDSRRVCPESSQAEWLDWRFWPQFAGSGDPCSPLQRSIIGPETRVQGPTPQFLLNLQERKRDLQRPTDDQSRTGQRVTLAGGPADGWNHRLGGGLPVGGSRQYGCHSFGPALMRRPPARAPQLRGLLGGG